MISKIWIRIRSFLIQFVINIAVLFLICVLWDWDFTCGAEKSLRT